MERSGRDTDQLEAIGRVSCGPVEEQLTFPVDDVRIDGATAVPVTRRPHDRVGGVTVEDDAVGGYGVTNSVVFAVAVGLVEEVDAVVEDDCTGSAYTVLLTALYGRDLADLGPVVEVGAFCNSDSKPVVFAAVAEWAYRIV
jgi:hypothetical protein